MANTSILAAFERMWNHICTKAESTHTHTWDSIQEKPENLATTDDINTAVSGKADKTYTDSQDTETLNSAKSYTDTKVAAFVDSAPETLDTLNELAAALGDDPNFATTVANQIGLKADKTYVDDQDAATLQGAKTYTDTQDEATLQSAQTYTDTEVDKVSILVGDTAVATQISNAISNIPQTDWNQNDETAKDYIKNRPFGEAATGGDTLTWDGVVGDRYFVPAGSGQFVHMSDSVPTKADVANGIVMRMPSNEIVLEGSQVQAMFAENGFATLETVVIIPTDNYVVDDAITFEKKGVYFVLFGETYTELFTINGYTGFPSVATIDEKYIPDTIARTEAIPTKTSQLTNDSDFATVSNIPTNVSQLTNDSGYLTEHQDISGKANVSDLTAHTDNTTAHITDDERAAWNAKSNFSGDYNDLTNKPTIPTVPTNVSAFTNDAGYLTSHQDISGKADITYVDGKFTDLVGDTAVPTQINTAVSGKADKTYVDSQDTSTLNSAKSYTDTKIANLLDNDTEAVDSIMELAEAMKTNADAIDALTTIAGSKADKTYVDGKFTDLVGDTAVTTQINTAVSSKVDKVDGKGLSTNDYTTEEKNKLAGIAAGADVNVQSDWNATSGDALILNKPTKLSAFENDKGYLTEHQDISGKADKTYTDTQDTTTLNTAKSYTDTEVGKISTLVGDTSVASQISTAVDDLRVTITTMVMSAANWDADAKTYSFEATYPAATYNLELELNGDVATEEQFGAFGAAYMVASANTNVVKAFGEVPTVDIPVILKVQVK